jgi:hypothetical protein
LESMAKFSGICKDWSFSNVVSFVHLFMVYLMTFSMCVSI